MIRKKTLMNKLTKMDTSTHKHRKGFRQDAEMLSEAYSSVYNEGQQPDWWQKIKVIEISDVDAGGGDGDAWISKAEIDGTELTDEEYEIVNNDRDFIETIARPLIDGDPDIAGGRSYTGPPAIEWAEDQEIGEEEYTEEQLLGAVNEAQLGLEKMHANINHEKIDVDVLADAYAQVSRALHFLMPEGEVEKIFGGLATQQAAATPRSGGYGEY